MKAMLIKDWKLMKGQKQFGLILCVFLAVFVVINDNLGISYFLYDVDGFDIQYIDQSAMMNIIMEWYIC